MLYITLFVSVFYVTLALSKNFKEKVEPKKKEVVKEVIKEEKEVETIKLPYQGNNITIGRGYYDYKKTKDENKNSITYFNDTYMQNSGIDYVSQNIFNVQSIMKGTVLDVKEDENIGKIIEIKHDNNYISVYEGLSETSVKKGDFVSAGMIIGKSGTNKVDESLGNHLHFELYIDGSIVNPEEYLGKEIKE